MAEEDSGITETPEEREERARREAELKKNAEGVAAAGATGLGCLGVALMPWTIVIILLIIVVIVAWIHSCR
jgi:hypothetical protein